MMELILGESRPAEVEVRNVAVEGGEPRSLLRNLLREVLWLHEAEGFATAVARVRVESGPEGFTAKAELRGGPGLSPPVRELKGVTLHGLEAREGEGGEWFARVIFDV
jgi:SHS2 domain-containing protein